MTEFEQKLLDVLGDIRDLQAASVAASGEMIERAQAAMAAAEAGEAGEAADSPIPVDVYPFDAVPAGTEARTLPDGGRLFLLADGAVVRVAPTGEMTFVDLAGEVTELEAARDRYVRLPDGRTLRLRPEAVRATHEAAGVSGLPIDVEPQQVAPGRFRIDLASGYRLDLSHTDRRLMLINPAGTIVFLTPTKADAIGEMMDVRIVAGGARSFRSEESNHQGVIEANGTIHLAMADGRDLVIRFPEREDDSQPDPPPRTFQCTGRCG